MATLPEYQQELGTHENFMRNLSISTGKDISTPLDMYFLYHALMAQSSMGLQLPEWTKNIFPEGLLLEGALFHYKRINYNKNMIRINGGMILRKIIDDMVARKNGTLDERRKVMLYSGHDFNVVSLLAALGVYSPHVPQYSSAVMIELHEVDKQYTVKVCYK